jgi:PAS domain S-box-containing protein
MGYYQGMVFAKNIIENWRSWVNVNPYDPPASIRENEVLLPLMGFPDVCYAAELSPVIEQKNNLKIALFYVSFSILVLTLAVSFFISRSVSRPLEAMANEAMSIASNPTNVLMKEEKAGYFEFRRLAEAFNKVLLSLFSAQEELKSEARKEMEEREERYRLTVETAPDTIVITRIKDGMVYFINKAGERMFGYNKQEALGKTVFELDSYLDYSDREKIITRLKNADEINRIAIQFKRRGGEIIDCFMSSRKIRHQGEDCIISIITDHTEIKKVEEEKRRLESALQRVSKMEAIGTMAGGVAHDLNNILSGLVGYPELLLMDLPEDSRLRKPILTIQKSGEKAAAIVQDMLTLARRGVAVTEVVNLNSIVREYLKSLEHRKIMAYNLSVTLKTDLEPDLQNIIGSNVHLSKTLMNLISNSVEAMPSGGEIVISTRNEYVDMPIKGYDTVNEGDYVVLTVSDNGIGISPEDQERIFEPFYTKKKMGRSGTGLGMAVVWGTVKDHDGYIDLKSDTGHGTIFKLYFPVTNKDLIDETQKLPIEKYFGRGESVLVVDDVPEQREIATNMLMKLGYSVASVSSGEEAIKYLKEKSADILVLDMIMTPGIDGLETYRRILDMRPGQKAIVASGFSETDRVREAQRLGAGAYVKKPYLMKNIGPAIRNELDK